MCNAAGAMSKISWIFMLVVYVVQAISLYRIGEKAGVKKTWVAFIPVLQAIVFLHVIDKSGWSIFLILVPGLNVVLGIIWSVKLYAAFSVKPVLIVLSIIIPIVGLVMMLVVAFSDQFAYARSHRFAP